MLKRLHTSPISSNALWARGIRTQIPPRPAVTVIAFLDMYGNVCRTKEETEISLVRTRDNKFWLQRIYANDVIVRFHCPGLEVLKHASNFEYFSIADLDNYGGICIPSDIYPTPANERPGLHDAVYCIRNCQLTEKFTRKDRRQWHRRLYAHWHESPEKYQVNWVVNCFILCMVAVWASARYYYMWSAGKGFFDDDVPIRAPQFGEKAKTFGERHPEHCSGDETPVQWSPGQHLLSTARSDVRAGDQQDTTGWHVDFMWKFRHAWYYKHWPRSMYA